MIPTVGIPARRNSCSWFQIPNPVNRNIHPTLILRIHSTASKKSNNAESIPCESHGQPLDRSWTLDSYRILTFSSHVACFVSISLRFARLWNSFWSDIALCVCIFLCNLFHGKTHHGTNISLLILFFSSLLVLASPPSCVPWYCLTLSCLTLFINQARPQKWVLCIFESLVYVLGFWHYLFECWSML